MADSTKERWTKPAVEPLTEADSRADVQDVEVRNAVVGSAVLN